MLKKRRRNPEKRKRFLGRNQDFPWDTAERRPLIKSASKEAGEDYWIDEDEWARYEQEQARKNQNRRRRKDLEGQVSEEKLWNEVKAPYQQNWIGYFSLGIAILTVIILQFPELLDQPIITIPDL